MAGYKVYPGKFPCHTCKEVVKTIRSYPEIKEVTWMCSNKHLSRVSFIKKTKKDFLNE